MRFRLIFNHAFTMAQYLLVETYRITVHINIHQHTNSDRHRRWEHVVTSPWRAPCEWMEVWLICSASESHGLAGFQSSARLFISFSHSQHSLTHTHTLTFGTPSATRTIPLDSQNVINLKQTQNSEAPYDGHKRNYANLHFKINLFMKISAVQCTIKVH